MEWEQVADLLKGAGIAHLATASADGRPHVSAVMPAVEDDVVWIATNGSSGKARNLRENPRVALMWQPKAEIYLYGRAAFVNDPQEKQRLSSGGVFGFNLAEFFPPDALAFVRVDPESVVALMQEPEGLVRHTWRRS
jgi:general stress protein 26